MLASAQMVTALLSREGYMVDVATSGQEAIEKTSVWQYDVVVQDLWCPRSPATVYWMSSTPRRVSATTPRRMDAAITPNVYALLHKPFDIEELVKTVRGMRCRVVGAKFATPEDVNERCKCGHAQSRHELGSGRCGYAGGGVLREASGPCTCQAFRPVTKRVVTKGRRI